LDILNREKRFTSLWQPCFIPVCSAAQTIWRCDEKWCRFPSLYTVLSWSTTEWLRHLANANTNIRVTVGLQLINFKNLCCHV